MKNIFTTPQNYFLEKPRHLDNPHGWIMHTPFAFYLVETLKPSIITELGTYSGNSYFAFCQAVKDLGLQSKCYAADTWQGDIHVGSYSEKVFERVNNINNREFSHFSHLLRMDFDKALSLFKDQSIDLLHIDGTHTYPAVKHDFESWLPKMSSQGIILLHDTCVKDKGFGVWKFLEQIKPLYPVLEFNFSEGLALVCTGIEIHPDILTLMENAKQKPAILKIFERLGENILHTHERDVIKTKLKSFQETKSSLNKQLLEKKKVIKQLKKQLKVARQKSK